MSELKVPETGGVVIRALDETASTVQCLAQRDGSLEGPAGKERLDPKAEVAKDEKRTVGNVVNQRT